MFATLSHIALPLVPLALRVTGRSLAWQIGAVALVLLLLALPDWLGMLRPPHPVDPAVALPVLLRSWPLRFSCLAVAVWAQLRWHRLFMPRLVSALFWIVVTAFPVATLLTLPIVRALAQDGAPGATPLSAAALRLYDLVTLAAGLGFLALALVVGIGTALLVRARLRRNRHAL